MLFAKSLHKSNFIKELFIGKFIPDYSFEENSESFQLLSVNENSMSIFNYIYERDLQMCFIEPKFSQELFFHIYDAKIIYPQESDLAAVIFLTPCGIILMKYNSMKNKFVQICSEILNLNIEDRNKLTNLKVHQG
jgi:hypothetical protein